MEKFQDSQTYCQRLPIHFAFELGLTNQTAEELRQASF